MRFAYADPPYPGLAWRYYRCDEVDHGELIDSLVWDYPDGWALSTSAEALPAVLKLCPDDVRVAAWVRGARPGKALRARSAWEPVIVRGGRPNVDGVEPDLADVLLWATSGRQRSHPDALVGMKSAAFCEWVFRLLGARQGDALDDLFPGSGIVSRAWSEFVSPSADSSLPSRFAGAARRLASIDDE